MCAPCSNVVSYKQVDTTCTDAYYSVADMLYMLSSPSLSLAQKYTSSSNYC